MGDLLSDLDNILPKSYKRQFTEAGNFELSIAS